MAEKPFYWPGRRPDDPAHDMLAAFLVMDIQRNPEWTRELSARIAEVKAGKLPVWERIGNAYRLKLNGQRALIEAIVDQDSPVQEVTLEDISIAAEAWIERFKI